MTTPADYSLPHDTWRPFQLEMIEKLLAKPDGSVTLLQAPVGSGKTSFSKAMGKSEKGVTSLVKTKLLQQSNYLESYNFSVLMGRSNYACPHPDQLDEYPTAANCLFESDMQECDMAEECPFLIARRAVFVSKTRSLNYSLFLSSRLWRLPKNATTYLVCDEAHLLADEVCEWVGMTVREPERIRFGLPEFPTVYQSTREGVESILKWMEQSVGVLETRKDAVSGNDASAKAQRSKIERLSSKLTVTCSAVHTHQQDWYARSGARALDGTRPGVTVKPLTARYHFSKMFLGVYPRTVLMSATIGRPELFAEELGIENYHFESVPNQYGPERRPVLVPACPVMGYKSTDAQKVEQAVIIARLINECPDDWEGVIHSTSWAQARDLQFRLGKAGVARDRLFVPEQGGGTNKQMDQWVHAKGKSKGRLIITPSMAEGVDLTQARINICAKVPFPSISPGSYDYERMLYSNTQYKWRTSCGLEQRMGRTRRGNESDYDTKWEKRGLVAIVDGAFKKQGIKRYCGDGFVESLVFQD